MNLWEGIVKMDVEKFIEEFKTLDLKSLGREQQEVFRDILQSNGLFFELEQLAKVIYEQNKTETEAIEGYVHSLLYLDKKDEALFVLYNAEKTAPILYLEGLIYQGDGLYEIAEEKYLQAKELTTLDEALTTIDKELVGIYFETGRVEKAKEISEKIFSDMPNFENFKLVFNNLMMLGLFEDVLEFYKKNGRDYEDASITFGISFAYNQLKDLENCKKYLLKTIELDSEYTEAYMHLGHLLQGEEAIKYLEKYIELQGESTTVYLHLISLYSELKEYNKIRELMQNVLMTMGISEETLFIAINALKKLYEYDKVFDLYNDYLEIKDDPVLHSLTLSVLSEEEDYIDFVEKECVTYFDYLNEEPYYYEALKNVYELTNNNQILSFMGKIDHKRFGADNH